MIRYFLSLLLWNSIPKTAGFSASSTPGQSGGGDQVRLALGNRPSLHPVTINAISEALQHRSRQILVDRGEIKLSSIAPNQESLIKIDSNIEGTEPMDVALAAGKIAYDAIAQRRLACEADNSLESDMYNLQECQCIAGRVVGVVTRFEPLENSLIGKVSSIPWVKKYNDYGSFGVLKLECETTNTKNEGSLEEEQTTSNDIESEVLKELLDNPLLRMSRAECLLALFLETVEKPKLELLQNKEMMPDNGLIDFLDNDRAEVLLEYM